MYMNSNRNNTSAHVYNLMHKKLVVSMLKILHVQDTTFGNGLISLWYFGIFLPPVII